MYKESVRKETLHALLKRVDTGSRTVFQMEQKSEEYG